MKINFRILLCILGIVATYSSRSFSSEVSAHVGPLIPSPEAIPASYVHIEIPETPVTDFSPQHSLQVFSTWCEEVLYSLLQWKSLTRPEVLMVESYDRVHHFGRWVHDRRDGYCLNTRAKVLVRDAIGAVVFEKENPCSVQSGEWNDPYANKILRDARLEVQIDHMVPLKNAYVSGAYKWNYKQRCLYGNYLGENFHLISVDGTENTRKSSAGPDGYMPPNKEYRCTYLKNWLMIKTLWGLEMTVSEAQAIKDAVVSENCDLATFHISVAEIKIQQKFAAENADLCAKVIPEAQL